MRLGPEDVGIPRAADRHFSGLRRAEVAQLADISLSYYTFIERGRDLRPSTGVLDSIGRALQLTAGERWMLGGLRGDEVRRPPLAREEIGEEIEEIEELVELLEPNPTNVMGASHFRESFAQRPDEPAFTSLLEDIFAVIPQARVWWERHDAPNRSGLKRIRIPDGRAVLLRQLVLESADNPEIQIVTYFADMSGDEDGGNHDDD
jgi:transcriptional regulator with XRE-family HTH domain